MRRVCRARALTDAIMCLLHLTFSVSTPLLIPVLISLSVEPDPLPLGALTFASIVTAMKLVSYAMCNGDFRWAPSHPLTRSMYVMFAIHAHLCYRTDAIPRSGLIWGSVLAGFFAIFYLPGCSKGFRHGLPSFLTTSKVK